MFMMDKVELEFDDEAILEIASIAASKNCSLWDAIEAILRFYNGYVKTGNDELDAEAEQQALAL